MSDTREEGKLARPLVAESSEKVPTRGAFSPRWPHAITLEPTTLPATCERAFAEMTTKLIWRSDQGALL